MANSLKSDVHGFHRLLQIALGEKKPTAIEKTYIREMKQTKRKQMTRSKSRKQTIKKRKKK